MKTRYQFVILIRTNMEIIVKKNGMREISDLITLDSKYLIDVIKVEWEELALIVYSELNTALIAFE